MSDPMIFAGGPNPIDFDGEVVATSVQPGMVLEQSGGGDGVSGPSPVYAPHSVAAGVTEKIIVDTDPYFGDRETTAEPINETLDTGDHVSAKKALPGTYARLRLAGGEALAVGDYIVSAGDGTVRAFDGAGGDTEAGKFGVVVEAADEGAGDTLVTVRII